MPRSARRALRIEDDERAFWSVVDTLDHSREDANITRLEYAGPPRDRHKGKGVRLRLDGAIIDQLKDVARTKASATRR